MHVTPEIQTMVGALLAGDLNTWEGGYFTHLMSRSMAEQARDYPVLRYDYPERHKLYRFVNDTVLKNRPIDYLEFGGVPGRQPAPVAGHQPGPPVPVFRLRQLRGPARGLALRRQAEGGPSPAGATSRPSTIRARPSSRAGSTRRWSPFLSGFKVKNQLVVHMDADLFSSTLYVLMTLNRIVAKGTVFRLRRLQPPGRLRRLPQLPAGLRPQMAHPGRAPGLREAGGHGFLDWRSANTWPALLPCPTGDGQETFVSRFRIRYVPATP